MIHWTEWLAVAGIASGLVMSAYGLASLN